MFLIEFVEKNWQSLLWSAGILAAAIGAALLARVIALQALRRLTRRKGTVLGQSLVKHGRGPSLWILPLAAVLAILPSLSLPPALMSALEHITGIGLIGAVAWLCILLVDLASDILANRYRVDVADNLVARRIQTQFQMMHHIVVILVSVVALSIMLMTIPAIKHIGVSILASAGLASLIVGMAMKGTLTNLIAGVQIAFAQPFRMGDVVVIQGEWGWIEEIGTMYVVLRIWDLRRLVIPLSYFLENSFENWTRTSADLLGYTYVYADYTVPVDAVRAELRRICESTKLWAGKVCAIQVTDADRSTVELRALIDARDSNDAWDLRCLVREKLIDFLQKNYPESLPRYRGEMKTKMDGAAGANKALLPESR
ncbi:MAG: mechanosensitive ion channel family protein [Terracidiphilus sp.]